MADKEAILGKLQEAYEFESTSLLTYLLEVSNPLSTSKDRAVADILATMASEESRDRAALANLVCDLGGSPDADTFDLGDAHYNYLSAGYLLDLVMKRVREQRAAFQRIADDVASEPRASELLRGMAERRAKGEAQLQAALDAAKKAAAPPPPKPAAPPAAKPAAPAAAAKPAAPAAAAAAPAPAAPKPAAPAPAAKPPLDPEKIAALKAAAEAKKAALAAGAAAPEKPKA
jgi:hypothetical protein